MVTNPVGVSFFIKFFLFVVFFFREFCFRWKIPPRRYKKIYQNYRFSWIWFRLEISWDFISYSWKLQILFESGIPPSGGHPSKTESGSDNVPAPGDRCGNMCCSHLGTELEAVGPRGFSTITAVKAGRWTNEAGRAEMWSEDDLREWRWMIVEMLILMAER